MNLIRTPFLLGLGLGLTLVAWAQGAGPGNDSVVLQLKWKHQFQFAGYYAAVAQGYYREAGLEVELREAVPGEDPVEEVLKGRAEFGVGTSELMLLRAQGRPVVVLASVFQHSPLVLLTLRRPGLDDLQALHDRPIMIEPQSAELFAYFKREGVDPAALKIQPHTFEVHDLVSGRVDAMTAYASDEPFLLRAAGIDYLTFTPRAGGIDFYGDNLFTTEEQIARHPERVRAFRAASLRGWEYAMAHPQEIIDLILRRYSQRKSREHLEFEATQTAQLLHAGLIEVGHVNPGRWRHMAETYAEFGMVPREWRLDGLLYDTRVDSSPLWVFWAIGVLAIVAGGTVAWAVPLHRLNRRLRFAKEAAEAADAGKSRYLAFLAHEVRTPMHGLVGLIELLKADGLNAEQRQQLELVEHTTQHLLQLIDSVLDHAKLEAGGMGLDLQPMTLPDFLRGLTDLYQVAARSKGLALNHEISPGVPDAIICDALRLRQILANLLSNAIKFTAAGSVALMVEALPAQTSGLGGRKRHRLFFMVNDSGPGIAADKLPHLFEPFVQADVAVAAQHGGSGLGLAISRRLAEMLGGTIRVESTPGGGSTFTVEIVVEEVSLDTAV